MTDRGDGRVSQEGGASDQGGPSNEPAPIASAAEERASVELGGFTPLGGETVYRGRIVEVRVERFRHADGEEVSREVVRHQGAVAIVAYDAQCVWLERQPREAVNEPRLLEIPAGRLDVAGEDPQQAAQRELAEEIGRGAREWEAILSYYVSAGITDERVHLFAATDLYESHAHSEENERIELVPWPLDRLQDAIAECQDAKTLIGLFWLARRLNA
jgi:8-oxo-dGTP pyrophosphatase MutT (NUDIX family)